jgi:hypothetical protein
MNNPETQATLDARHKTNSNKTKQNKNNTTQHRKLKRLATQTPPKI